MIRRLFAVFFKQLIIAEPTIAPSAISAIFFACSGVEIPNPNRTRYTGIFSYHFHNRSKVCLDFASRTRNAETGNDI